MAHCCNSATTEDAAAFAAWQIRAGVVELPGVPD